MLSQTVEYALRAVVHLAGVSPQTQTTAEIVAVTQTPPAYLSKVLQALRNAGVVRSQRGPQGGMQLVKAPQELTILEIVNAVEPLPRIRTCPLNLKSHGVRLCPLHARLDAAYAAMETAFGSTTLAEVLAEPGRSRPLCDVPPTTAPDHDAGSIFSGTSSDSRLQA